MIKHFSFCMSFLQQAADANSKTEHHNKRLKIGPSCFDSALVPYDTTTFLSQKNKMEKCVNDINAECGQLVKSKILGLKKKLYFFTFKNIQLCHSMF